MYNKSEKGTIKLAVSALSLNFTLVNTTDLSVYQHLVLVMKAFLIYFLITFWSVKLRKLSNKRA